MKASKITLFIALIAISVCCFFPPFTSTIDAKNNRVTYHVDLPVLFFRIVGIIAAAWALLIITAKGWHFTIVKPDIANSPPEEPKP